MHILAKILPAKEPRVNIAEMKINIPTLFGPTQEKLHLAVLTILCGKDVEDGFEFASRIIQDYKLKPPRDERFEDLIKLISDRGSKISAYIEAKQLKSLLSGSQVQADRY
ncbi:hypothetical protein NQ317_018397 [Molorchus minor]|uniref:Uncharacterized protein n=1 Tax=Molorchus minor TaxID=1323400 RepID=A0ABQ9J7Q4_9CUCU|nr:hypothetical protein NQ317_018397 [Molorchus minor]